MVSLLFGRNRLTQRALGEPSCLPLVLGLLALANSPTPAQEKPAGKGHLELMQAAVSSLEAETEDAKFNAALTLVSKPLLRYSDPTRGAFGGPNVLLDGGVWRLGTKGRPTALVTIEIYGNDEPRLVGFEFLSLTETKFDLKHKTEQIRWEAPNSALVLKELPKALKPAATAALRLAQMRQLVRRFAVKESYRNDTVECRLLAQPIDRYHSASATDKIVDGAIFAFANGTNPEMGIVFETDGAHWQYGTLRLSAAALTVTLDGREVAAYESYNGIGRTSGPYHNAHYRTARNR